MTRLDVMRRAVADEERALEIAEVVHAEHALARVSDARLLAEAAREVEERRAMVRRLRRALARVEALNGRRAA